MRTRNDVGQRVSSLQRICLLLCVLLLFAFVAVVLFWVPNAYAQNVAGIACGTSTPVVPTKTPSLPTPTPTTALPVPTPTTAPVPTPTTAPVPTPTTAPVPTATTAPVPTPITTPPSGVTPVASAPNVLNSIAFVGSHILALVPCTTPTAVIQPTNPAAGGLPLQPSPTHPILKVTKTPQGSGLPPTATAAATPTDDTNTPYISTAVSGQDNGKMLLPSVPDIAIGTSVLGAAALIGWYVWRRRQDSAVPANYAAVSVQRFNTPAPMSYTQTGASNNTSAMVGANEPDYQSGVENQGMLPIMTYSAQTMQPDTGVSLEAIMQQARQGLFALPNKEEYT